MTILIILLPIIGFIIGIVTAHEWGVRRRANERPGMIGRNTSLTPSGPEEWPW